MISYGFMNCSTDDSNYVVSSIRSHSSKSTHQRRKRTDFSSILSILHIYYSFLIQQMLIFCRILNDKRHPFVCSDFRTLATNLLQRFGNNFGHFDIKFCFKFDKTNQDFSKEIADCCSIRLATLPQKDRKNLLKFLLKFFQKNFIRKFGIAVKVTNYDA